MNLTGQIIVSILCLVVCFSSLSFVTLAWFNDTVAINSVIQTGTYDMSISVKSLSDPSVLVPSEGFKIDANQRYVVTITASGTATTGFCQITIDGETYYTQSISTKEGENTFTFTINSFKDSIIHFNPQWGSYSEDVTEDKIIKNGDIVKLGDGPQMSEDTVIDGLSDIIEEQPSIESTDEIDTDSLVEEMPEIDIAEETITPSEDTMIEQGNKEEPTLSEEINSEQDNVGPIISEEETSNEIVDEEEITTNNSDQDLEISDEIELELEILEN